VILRRRGDLDLVMAQLGGNLFATRGDVDNYWEQGLNDAKEAAQSRPSEDGNSLLPQAIRGDGRKSTQDDSTDRARGVSKDRLQIVGRIPERVIDAERVRESVADHIRFAPEREAAALRNWAKPGSIINFNTAETQALAMWKVLKSL
jgi:hypothetical protein